MQASPRKACRSECFSCQICHVARQNSRQKSQRPSEQNLIKTQKGKTICDTQHIHFDQESARTISQELGTKPARS